MVASDAKLQVQLDLEAGCSLKQFVPRVHLN